MGLSTPGGVDPAPYVRAIEQQPTSTFMQPLQGTPTQSYQQRRWNTITNDDNNLAAFNSPNVLTLQPGTYRMMILVPCFVTSYHRARLLDLTNSNQYLGHNASCSVSDMDESFITGQFTIAAAANFQIESFIWITGNVGGAVSEVGNDERYTIAEFWQVQP